MAKVHNPEFTIDQYVSSNKGSWLKVGDTRVNEPDLNETPEVFAFEDYQKPHNFPLEIPALDTEFLLKQEFQRCLDMPLRLSGTKNYALPEEWQTLAPLLESIIAVEHAHNPHWADYHTYLTIDAKYVVKEEQQRHGGLHVDGFQGSRIEDKTKITRNYVLTTNGGTRFYQQPFIVVDETKFNVFQGFDLQAEANPMVAKENTIYFMNAYTVHESGLASYDGLRTFLRLTYDLKKFDRAGNTHNSMLDYSWDMVARNVHNTVATPTLADIEGSPYHKR